MFTWLQDEIPLGDNKVEVEVENKTDAEVEIHL